MTEPLCCSPESITVLLIGYTSIQNKKLKKQKQFYLLVTCKDWSLPFCMFEGRITLNVFQLIGDSHLLLWTAGRVCVSLSSFCYCLFFVCFCIPQICVFESIRYNLE